jgi:hypothetical protein
MVRLRAPIFNVALSAGSEMMVDEFLAQWTRRGFL